MQAKAYGASMRANADLATMEAEAAKKSGEYEEAQLKRQKEQVTSKQKALYAKSGIVLSEGSPLEVMSDTAGQYEMDIMASRYNTATQVAQKQYESNYLRTMGQYYSGPMAKAYRRAGYIKGGATLLTGGYNVAKNKGW
jgi:hypothetical protein